MKILFLVTLFLQLLVSSIRAESMGNGTGNNTNQLALELARSVCSSSNDTIYGCLDLKNAIRTGNLKEINLAIKSITDSLNAPGN